ncbi:hypothetical protein AAVH_14590 [Aphelenchoides avenae]|nr:hypothetical protein AAVH_14590 [Aphelenchus avenae]
MANVGCSTVGFAITEELVKTITKSARTIDMGVLQFSNGYIFVDGGRFKALISSFQALNELKISNCRGGRTIVTNGLLRLLARKGTKLTADLEPTLLRSVLPCRVNDDAVLDYLFNPKHAVKQRYLWMYQMSASRHFLFNLILDLRHYSEGLYRVTFDDGKEADILDFAEENFCARLSFYAADGTMRHFRFTTVKEDFANIGQYF